MKKRIDFKTRNVVKKEKYKISTISEQARRALTILNGKVSYYFSSKCYKIINNKIWTISQHFCNRGYLVKELIISQEKLISY